MAIAVRAKCSYNFSFSISSFFFICIFHWFLTHSDCIEMSILRKTENRPKFAPQQYRNQLTLNRCGNYFVSGYLFTINLGNLHIPSVSVCVYVSKSIPVKNQKWLLKTYIFTWYIKDTFKIQSIFSSSSFTLHIFRPGTFVRRLRVVTLLALCASTTNAISWHCGISNHTRS